MVGRGAVGSGVQFYCIFCSNKKPLSLVYWLSTSTSQQKPLACPSPRAQRWDEGLGAMGVEQDLPGRGLPPPPPSHLQGSFLCEHIPHHPGNQAASMGGKNRVEWRQRLRLSLGRGPRYPRLRPPCRKTHWALSTPPSSIYLSANPQEATAQVGSDHTCPPRSTGDFYG